MAPGGRPAVQPIFSVAELQKNLANHAAYDTEQNKVADGVDETQESKDLDIVKSKAIKAGAAKESEAERDQEADVTKESREKQQTLTADAAKDDDEAAEAAAHYGPIGLCFETFEDCDDQCVDEVLRPDDKIATCSMPDSSSKYCCNFVTPSDLTLATSPTADEAGIEEIKRLTKQISMRMKTAQTQ